MLVHLLSWKLTGFQFVIRFWQAISSYSTACFRSCKSLENSLMSTEDFKRIWNKMADTCRSLLAHIRLALPLPKPAFFFRPKIGCEDTQKYSEVFSFFEEDAPLSWLVWDFITPCFTAFHSAFYQAKSERKHAPLFVARSYSLSSLLLCPSICL